MENQEGTNPLAAWIRQPELWSLTVTGLGLGFLAGSLAMPVGFGGVVLAFAGAASVVAGLLTLVIVLLGRLTGLRARSEKVVLEGRPRIVFPGGRPDGFYLRRSGGRTSAAATPISRDAAMGTLSITDNHERVSAGAR